MGNRVDHALPRLTVKPLPTTEAAWRAEVLGLARFIIECLDKHSGTPYDWAEKIAAGYAIRLADLQLHKPKRPPGRPRRVRVSE